MQAKLAITSECNAHVLRGTNALTTVLRSVSAESL